MPIYTAIISGIWFVFIVYWLVSAFNAKKNAVGSRYMQGIWIRVVILIIFIFLFQNATFRQDIVLYQMTYVSSLTAGIGVIFCIAGIALAVWARLNIGRNWGMPMSLKKDVELVMTGPYAFVRHPIYAGVLLAAFGSALAEGVIWFLFFIFFFVYFLWSAQIEEKIMTEQFPIEYPLYKKRTKMLIPFLF